MLAERTHRRALAAAVLVTVLWSSSWVLIRVGLDDADLPPLTFAGLRYATAAAVLWVWLAPPSRRSELRRWRRPELAGVVVLGVVFYAVTQGAQFVAIDRQPAATTSLILSLTPLVVAVSGARTLGEAASRRQMVGGAVVVVGSCVYFAGDLGATTVGLIAAGTALVANVTSSLLGRHVNRGSERSAAAVTCVGMTVGSALLLLVGLAIEDQPSVTATAVAIIGWLAIVNTAVAFTLWNHALRHLSAVESAGINNLMLIQIALLAWLFLGEAPGPAGIVGVVLVSVGVFLTQRATST